MENTMSCKLKLKTTAPQKKELFDTAIVCRKAINYVYTENYNGDKATGMNKVHQKFYAVVREKFGLSSQYAADVNRETRSTFNTLWTNQKKELQKPPEERHDHFTKAPVRKNLTMQLSLNRNVSVFPDSQKIHITTLNDRIKNIPFSGHPDHIKALQSGRMGDPKLWFDPKKKTFYLIVPVTVEIPENKIQEEVTAIDVGERHIAGIVSTSGRREILDLPDNYATIKASNSQLRGKLMSKGTRSAKRRIRKMGKRERLFVVDTLHVLTKAIVTSHPNSIIVMEDLTDIRDGRTTFRGGKTPEERQEARRRAEQWPFREFREFITHKHGKLNGGSVVLLDPAYTSQTCPHCGYIDAENRNGDKFQCLKCGHKDHADLVAGDNLIAKYQELFGPNVNWPDGGRTSCDAPSQAQTCAVEQKFLRLAADGVDKPPASAGGG